MSKLMRACLLPLLVILIPLSNLTYAKDYDLTEVRIRADIQADGSVRITETRTYQFDGSFSYAYRDLLLNRIDRISDISVADETGPLTFSNSEDPGTYEIDRDRKKARVTWHYRAENESRTFTISYTLEGALVVGPEWAEFTRNYIGKEWEEDSENVTLTIHFDEEVGAQLYTWLRSDARQVDRRLIKDGVVYTAPVIRDDQYLGVRSVFPKSAVAQASVTHPDFNLQLAKTQESERQRQEAIAQARAEEYKTIATYVIAIIVFLSIASYVWLYREYGTRPEIPSNLSTNVKQLVRDYTPAEAGYLMNKTVTASMIMATLFDLARRGYFTIEEQDETSWLEKTAFKVARTDQSAEDANFRPHERKLFDFVNQRLNKDTDRLTKIFKSNGFEFSNFTQDWKIDLKKDVKQFDWFDKRSEEGRTYAIAIQVFLTIAGYATIIWAGPLGLFAGAIPSACILFSILIAHRTAEGRMLYERFKAYKKELESGNYDDTYVEQAQHFVFAVTFGLPQTKMKSLVERMDPTMMTGYWLILLPGSDNDPSAVVNSVSAMTAVATTSVSGAGGAAAGAASGGGGGGAG
jgi:uncharacterized membrane protein